VGKLFFVLTTLAFVGGGSYLIRAVQGRPTALELLPLVWAYDRFVYDGILNYHLALGLCLLTIGYLHRATDNARRVPSRFSMAVLACLGVLTYFSHILGWVPLCLAIAVYSALLCLRERSWRGMLPMLSLLPSTLLLVWYVASRSGGISWVLYPSLTAKLYAWAPAFLLFFRLDPLGLQPPMALVLNVGVWAVMAGMVIGFADRGQRASPGDLFHAAPLLSALSCLACAALIPFYLFANMGRPDVRFLQPAMWLAIASVRYRKPSGGQTAAPVLLVMLVLAVNLVQFARASPQLVEVFEALHRAVPKDTRVYSVSLRSPPLSLSEAVEDSGLINFTVGMPILDYFDLYRFIAHGGYTADLGMFGIAWLANSPTAPPPQLRLATLSNRDLRATAAAIRTQAGQFDIVELFGQSSDVRAVEAYVAPALVPVASGTHYSVLAPVAGSR